MQKRMSVAVILSPIAALSYEVSNISIVFLAEGTER